MSERTSRQLYARPVLKALPNEQRDLGKHAVQEPLRSPAGPYQPGCTGGDDRAAVLQFMANSKNQI
jgi:hypothetical protein